MGAALEDLKTEMGRRIAALRTEVHALYLAGRDPLTPWYAKALIALVVGYALSPVDLIPDFIPLLGYLDDLVIIPAGIWLAVRLIPPQVLDECRGLARASARPPANRVAGAVILAIWLLAVGAFVYCLGV